MVADIRVGQGFDIHRFSDDPARVLVLGGRRLRRRTRPRRSQRRRRRRSRLRRRAPRARPGSATSAMHFPDTDPRWAGADSIEMLRHVGRRAGRRCVGVGQHRLRRGVRTAQARSARGDEMQSTLTSAVGAPVSIKGNRAEQFGAIGRGEGIVCFADRAHRRRDRRSPHEPSTEQRTRPETGQDAIRPRQVEIGQAEFGEERLGIGQAVRSSSESASSRPRVGCRRRSPEQRPTRSSSRATPRVTDPRSPPARRQGPKGSAAARSRVARRSANC